ncbi:MAG: hypothetical protein C0467_22900 [Planctomycetaceae bacterium]|nr:hypothetical protein [Planctomycetaceae bacterium]
MADPIDQLEERERQLAERAASIAHTRDELRAERERIAADRAKADRLLAEAQHVHEEATRARSRARRLAGRFASNLEQRTAAAREKLGDQLAALERERARLESDIAQFNATRSDFHATAAATQDRLADAWAVVESQQQRAAGEWAEANRYYTEQNAALDARAAEVEQRERGAADRLARAEADAAGLQEEAAALEQRVKNARAALAELEHRRDLIRAELLHADLPDDLIQTVTAGDFATRERDLNRDRVAVAALRASLERESADVDDRRRLVAEQLDQLADARARWQRAERQTVLEMEELARSLRHKEQELDTREQRLIRADARRRIEAYDLWQLRLRLESWQSKLTAFEVRWHTEREQLEAHLERRIATAARREAAHAATFARWEQARTADHTRLREELKYWATDREQMNAATSSFDQLQQATLDELAKHASHALAADQLVGETLHDAGSKRVVRRLRVLRKRWERVFARHAKAIIAHRTKVTEERAALEERYRDLHERLVRVGEREAEANSKQTIAERRAILDANPPAVAALAPAALSAPSAELTALRAEVERLATVVLEIDLPESEIPWAIEESDAEPKVLSFESGNRAA